MHKRHKMSKSGSRHSFTKHASYTHKKNLPYPGHVHMRGGIRL